ncbi:MAG: DUF4245 family protein [Sciscionella sp.]
MSEPEKTSATAGPAPRSAVESGSEGTGTSPRPERIAEAPRRPRWLRDMGLSMLALAVLVLAVTAIGGGFSVNPGGPTKGQHVLTPQNVAANLRSASGQVHFPVRLPVVPPKWQSNSFAIVRIGSGSTAAQDVQEGWVTDRGNYLRLSQTSGSVRALVNQDAGTPGDGAVSRKGTRQVGGTRWTVYPGVRAEHTWVRNIDGVHLSVTGSGTPAEFRALAAAAQSGKKLRPET